jgi:YbbR domain-containing protein
VRDHAPSPASPIGPLAFRPTRVQVVRFAFSLLIATILWGWVTELNDPFITVRYRELDVSAGPLDDSLRVVTTLPRASVILRGPESRIDEIDRDEISVVLDTSEVTQAGEYRLELDVVTPEGPSSKSVDPAELSVTIEQEISEVIPLEVRHAVPQDDPREITSTVAETTQVTVSGPSSSVGRVEEVILPVSLGNHQSSFEETFTPYAVDSEEQRVSEVRILPEQIMTSVEIRSRGKTVSVIPVIEGVPAEGFSVQQRAALPDSIIVDGPDEALESLLFVNTEPVSIAGATQSISSEVGLSELPPGVTVIEPESGKVEVRVAIEDTTSTAQTLTGLRVEPINLEPGLAAVIEPEGVNVTVDGPGSTLSSMTPSDVKTRVDVSGLGPGTYEVAPDITVPQGVTWVGNSPEMVQVTISAVQETPRASPIPQASPDA